VNPLQAPAAFVIGTAGHIDHGKSSLVKALTGIDPDRLEEEKRRGMTIDLGFAYMDLPSGRHLGIIDVPGHQRFLKNMLAGVHGIDAVLFVVAADEGPMPQTHEHLAILDLLGVTHGVIALTKADLVDSDWLRLVSDEVHRVVSKTALRAAPIIPVSALSGTGLDQLKDALDQQLAGASPRPDTGRPRLAVDRSFAMSGFGTVVTGTLVGGSLRVGDDLALYPTGRSLRVRGLQQHNRTVDLARPGSRTAVNVVGADRKDIARGHVIAPPRQLSPTRRLDVRLSVLASSAHPIPHRAALLLYLGTAEVPVELSLLEDDIVGPGSGAWAQIFSDTPVVAVVGDRFILRRPAPIETVAGGVILDTNPRRHRRHDPRVIADLEGRERGDPAATLMVELGRHRTGVTIAELARRTGMDAGLIDRLGGELIAAGSAVRLDGTMLSRDAWEQLEERARIALEGFHRVHPLRAGMPREELRSRVGLAASLFPPAVARMALDGLIIERGSELALPGHQANPSPDQQVAIAALISELEAAPFAPPPLPDLAGRYQLTPALLQYLTATGRIIRLNDDTIFAAKAYQEAVDRLTRHLQREGKVTVAQARDLLGSSRRYVLPLLEWLDAQKVTRRVGDDRILRV